MPAGWYNLKRMNSMLNCKSLFPKGYIIKRVGYYIPYQNDKVVFKMAGSYVIQKVENIKILVNYSKNKISEYNVIWHFA
jgi:hypothetical protein